jgi:hypothetical protein
MEGFTKWLGQLPMLIRRQRGQLLEALRPAIGLDPGLPSDQRSEQTTAELSCLQGRASLPAWP